ncbi:DUF998 domain-containing protein [Nocardiopsis sp. ARC36]
MPNSGQLHWDSRDGRVAAVAAAVAYSLWTLEVVLPGGGAAAQGALADPDAAFGRFLDSAHRVAAILVVVAAALGLAMGARETVPWLTVSWWSMAVFGAASLVAAVLPGRCVVATDAACAAESLAEGAGGTTAAQGVFALVAILAALVGVAMLAVDRYRAGDRAWPLVAVVAVLQAVAALAVLVLAFRVYAAAAGDGPGAAPGLLERAHLVTVALWLLTAGLLRGPWRRTGPARPADLSP